MSTSSSEQQGTYGPREPHEQHEQPQWAAQQEASVVRRADGPAIGTVVWGVVVLAAGLLLAAHELTDLRVDFALALPIGLIAVGALLVLGAVATAVRAGRRSG